MRERLGDDIFGEPYFEDLRAKPEPERLPEFTRETLPPHYKTRKQIVDDGKEPVVPAAGVLVWTPSGGSSPRSARVYDARAAEVPGQRAQEFLDFGDEPDNHQPPALAPWSPFWSLASWSSWVPLATAEAPRSPGVYVVRRGPGGPLVYVGMAGERQGEGLRGRLRRYTSGKALASGLGEAVFDRALADAAWLGERVDEVRRGEPKRATQWGKSALAWADLHICWAVTESREVAEALEKHVLALVL